MKKAVLVIAALGATYVGMAQDKYVTSAFTAYNAKDYDEAKMDIDKAMSSPETKEKPKALFVKGNVYVQLQQIDKYKDAHPYREAMQAYMKLAEVKPDYEKDEVNGKLFYGAQMYYNDAIKAYDEKKYAEAIELLKNTVKIHDLGGGKRFEKFQAAKYFDTVAARAYQSMANCAYSAKNNEEAIRLISIVKNNPITKSNDNYIILLESYEKFNKDNANKMAAEELAATQEARAAYPNDVNIRNMEMNTYLRMGKLNELLKKMEETAAAEPNNADVNFNVGLLYQGMASPKEGTPKPANAAELYSKSEAAFTRAVRLSPESAPYNYNFGTLYYMQAYDINAQMNNVTGNSAADLKKYDALKLKRDEFFTKATPYFEKAYSVLTPNEKNLGDLDRDIYHSVLKALREIYTINNKTDKMNEVAAKLKAMEQ